MAIGFGFFSGLDSPVFFLSLKNCTLFFARSIFYPVNVFVILLAINHITFLLRVQNLIFVETKAFLRSIRPVFF